MTTLAAAPAAPTRTAGIPMTRLVRVELRKLVDTRAGFWLAASIGLLSVVVVVAMLIANRNSLTNLTFGQFFGMMNIPLGIILPVMAILLVTGEWSQRSALTTFTMEPRRERIIVAKLLTALIASVIAVGLALVLGAVGNVIAGLAFADPAGAWSFTAAGLVNSFVLQLFGLLLGFGFAALILNTPGAIVAYFVLPTTLTLVSQLVPWFHDHLGAWVDPGMTNAPFQSEQWASGGEWAKLVVSGIVWIGIPLFFGVLRILRGEVK
ncbi:ABC transporter permease [Gordonia polyisoprenivorans]|uniref:ABC transporter permease n=1 Tax=Gordonia polyisoprenivorans TaxID=84595 RepID=UPI001AD79BE5|nr:ABC transporter permease [Gordonia polyisoprenivorans]QTI67896.1 ABC transporter permease [Gordonia polyisoprenivorans]